MFYGILVGELLLLFLLSQALTRSLSSVLYRLTRSRKITIYILAFLLLPGTFIHELAHLCMAVFLRVPTGEMKLFPEVQGNMVKLGSVAIAITDPIRRMFIGVAPFIIGTIFLIATLYSLTIQIKTIPPWLLIIFIYGIFEIGNTMFSSKKDLEGTIELFGATIVIGSLLYFLHVHIPASVTTFFLSSNVLHNVQSITTLMLIPLGIDVGIIVIIHALEKLFRR